MKKSPSSSTNAYEYITHIDGLLAIAILWVVLFHAFPGKFSGGFVGVDIFFVISGFLITRQILKAHTEGSWRFLDFYHRRAKRILPAFLLVLLTSCGISFFLLPDEWEQWRRHVMASLGFYQNFQLFWESGYIDGEHDGTRP